MDFVPHDTRLVSGAYWLIKLRWIAIAWVCLAAYTARYFFNINVQNAEFYCVSAGLVLENILALILLKYYKQKDNQNSLNLIKGIINFQIIFDLSALITLVHYSGGIENPIYIFFIFHMVITSLFLSKLNSYLITTFALILLCGMTFLEYYDIIPHYNLWLKQWSIRNNLYKDVSYILESLTVFIISSYLLAYMSNYIVSLLRRQQKDLQQANSLLQQKDAIKNEYVLRLTHDIKGHLAAIQTNLTLFNDKILGTLNEKQEEFINSTYNRSIKLTHFVNTLLKLTYMRLNDKIEIETFSLKDSVENIIASVKNTIWSKSITLVHNIDPSIGNIVNNQFSIEELITSLILNALKYTPEYGRIVLIIKDQDNNVLIEISDTGIGIPQEELPKIFDEFYRASNAKKIEKDGTGLGLAIAKQITQMYGGKIWVESEENSGTTFFVCLPKDASQNIEAFRKKIKN